MQMLQRPADIVDLVRVAEKFGLGKVKEFQQNGRGSINQTYTVTIGGAKFMLQKLAPIFDGRMIVDSLYIHGWLSGRGLRTPRPIPALDGRLVISHRGNLWRASEFVEHDPGTTKNQTSVCSAAEALGHFHRLLTDCPYEPAFSLVDFHNTKLIVAGVECLVWNQTLIASEEQKVLADFISGQIKKRLWESSAQSEIIHGDPKFDNFLFIKDEVVAVVDLDTVMRLDIRYDLGDAFRSWCRVGENEFSDSLFNAAFAAYNEANHLAYSAEEFRSMMGLVTLELAARYLEDSFHQSYFAWDASKFTSAKEHNLDRCRKCCQYYSLVVGN